MKISLTIVAIFFYLTTIAQHDKRSVVIGSNTIRPNALLIVNPENADQGVLLPQLSSGQRLSLKPTSPQEDGLILYDKNAHAYFYWGNGQWKKMTTDEGRQTKFFSIDPVDFQQLSPNNNVRHNNIVVFESDDAFVTIHKNDQGNHIIAPVNIPHGATLKEMTLFYMDNHHENISVRLLRKGLTGGTEQIASWTSSGRTPEVRNVSFSDFGNRDLVDLENFTYRLVATFDLDNNENVDSPAKAHQRLYGIRITYEE